MDDTISIQGAVCLVPLPHSDKIVLGHGSGGRMSHELIQKIFRPFLDNPILAAADDAGVITLPNQPSQRMAISTDAHVVSPLFFRGGDIGRLAICGTVNDIAMMGARPLYLTASFILEEGLDIAILERVVCSMKAAAQEAGIQVVAGDTKVVQKGKADGLYISTSGIGVIDASIEISGSAAQAGDQIILSGPIGDHGIAVLAARGELGLTVDVASDVAPLNHLVADMLQASPKIHVLRDPTRGGLATTLNEIAQQSKVGMRIYEDRIKVRPPVQAACEMLGFDPLYIANEGKLIACAAPDAAEKILAAMQHNKYGIDAAIIGEVIAEPPGRVLLQTEIGANRIVDMLAGELLPRIC